MEILHTSVVTNVQQDSFSCVKDCFAYITTKNYSSVIALHKTSDTENAFFIPFTGSVACLIDDNDQQTVLVTIKNDTLQKLCVSWTSRKVKTVTLRTSAYWWKSAARCDMYRVSATKVCVSLSPGSGVICDTDSGSMVKHVPWKPPRKFLHGFQYMYTTDTPLRVYMVTDELFVLHVACVDIFWSTVSTRGAFVACCVQ